jgi:helicase MOV-10
MTSLALAGDHLQLGPIVRSSTALQWRMDRSLMERMVKMHARECIHVTKLTHSYRAHPMILKVSYKIQKKVGRKAKLTFFIFFYFLFYTLQLYSELFYKNELIACADPSVVNSLTKWPHLPNNKIPMMFAHLEGKEDREKNSPSWFNGQEVDMVNFFIAHLTPFVATKDILAFSFLNIF